MALSTLQFYSLSDLIGSLKTSALPMSPLPGWTNKARVKFVFISKLSGGIKTI